jgi:uncharacterized membrane protein
MMKKTAETDHLKKKFLFELVKSSLQKLNVSFTASFLKRAIDNAYDLTFETEFREEHHPNKITVADREDPGNLAIVLLEVLKRYHIKHEVTDAHNLQEGNVALFISSGNKVNNNYQQLITIQTIKNDVRFPETLENIVILKTSEFTGEPSFRLNRNKELLNKTFVFLFITLATITFLTAIYKAYLRYSVLMWAPALFLLLAGCFMCYHLFLLEKSNTYASKFLKKVCGVSQTDFDCKEVISSPASRLFGLVSHTDIGILYFSSMLTLMVIALSGNMYEHYQGFLFWASVLPVPYTLFSIYYQLGVVKRICVMCMMVQVILWMQLVYYLIVRSQINIAAVEFEIVLQAGVIVGMIAALYFIYLENIKFKSLARSMESALVKLRSNNLFFEAEMAGQIKFIQDDFPVIFYLGQPSATEKLSVILSFFCMPCGDKLNELLKLADWFEDQIYIQIILKPDAQAAPLIKQLLVLVEEGETKQAVHRLRHWYSFFQMQKERNPYDLKAILNRWNEEYPIPAETEEIKTQYDLYAEFYERYPVPFTPLMQYNDQLLPASYQDPELLSERISRMIEQEQDYEHA